MGNKRLIEQKIGKKIKLLRKYRGLSQIELAERVGISFQQIQKYEKGSSSISVNRLYQISRTLGVPAIDFFEEETAPKLSDNSGNYASGSKALFAMEALSVEEVNFLKLFRTIKNKKVRQGILKQLQGISEIECRE